MSAERRLETIQKHLSMSSAVEQAEAAGSSRPTRWAHVEEAPLDPILGLNQLYLADTHPQKLNLGVGAYRTEEGKPFVLRVVRKAEKILYDRNLNKEYIPIDGLPEFLKETAKLIFGADSPAIREGRVATCQSISGTGAVRLGAEFLKTFMPGATIYVSNPTWGNHNKIFALAGLKVKQYRYFDSATKMLDFKGMCEDLMAAPENSIILLHTCAHNPTGVDPTMAEWTTICDIMQSKNHLPFFDTAYQGFASGDLDKDAGSVRLFVSRGMELLCAQSYSKNLGLYGERVGAINFVCATPEATKRVASQVKSNIVRPMYSSPHLHGARIVALVLSDPALFAEWLEDLKAMADRIMDMRKCLFDALTARGTPGDWTPIMKQIGMFTFTGMTPQQVDVLINKYHIYLTRDGRISMAGLSRATTGYLADSMDDVIRNVR